MNTALLGEKANLPTKGRGETIQVHTAKVWLGRVMEILKRTMSFSSFQRTGVASIRKLMYLLSPSPGETTFYRTIIQLNGGFAHGLTMLDHQRANVMKFVSIYINEGFFRVLMSSCFGEFWLAMSKIYNFGIVIPIILSDE